MIDQLAADDPAVRQSAARALVTLGMVARPAVLKALHDPDPQIRQAAANIILRLPWANPDEPQPAHEILSHYTDFLDHLNPSQPAEPHSPIDNRIAAVEELAALPQFNGFPSLIRLLHEDPSSRVRWLIVHDLRTSGDGTRLAALRNEPDPDDPPLAAACAMAWIDVDPAHAQSLYQKVLDAEWRQGPVDNDELSNVLAAQVALLDQAGDDDTAASLLRTALEYGPPLDHMGIPLPLRALFYLQATRGPLKGFDNDLVRAGQYVGNPEILFCLVHLYARTGDAARSQTAHNQAVLFSATRAQLFEIASFLAESQWDQDAQAEFKAALSLPSIPQDEQDRWSEISAHFQLAWLAGRRDDPRTAAAEEQEALFLRGDSDPETLAKIQWYALQAAVKDHNQTAIDDHLSKLITLRPEDPEIAITVVPLLKSAHRLPEAAQFFSLPYGILRNRLAADPENCSTMNDLAWLEASCDANLPEALTLATRAVAVMPRNPALIDTLATVDFHLKRYAEAAALEKRALAITPDDVFMQQQLQRFESATTQP